MSTASRLLLVKKDGTALVGVSAKTISAAGSSVDITTDSDSGRRTLADFAGVNTLDISGSGISKDQTLRELALTNGGQLFTDITIEYPPIGGQTTGDTISGDFWFGSFSEAGSGSDQAITFDFSMESSGEWTFTAGS